MFDELKPITTLAEVKTFASYLFFDLATALHPDDDFNDYVDANGKPTFNHIRAERLNERMDECRGICEAASIDVCEVMGIAVDYFKAIAEGASPDDARNALKSRLSAEAGLNG